ncbi:MAG: ASKHA domain-containing protein [Candidatus Merdivicinus sp.]|jgi:uncharacterized 2Fe-2S/4Fe-4S cluster protein (DUF4445 family)
MTLTVHTSEGSQTFSVEQPAYLSEILALHEHPLDLPCAGNGRCGKCRVKASGALSPLSPEEEKLLTSEDLTAGIRLACRTKIVGDAEVTLSNKSNISVIQTDAVSRNFERDQTEGYGVGIDIGTTTVAATLVECASGRELASACEQNPQEKYGADVISRIERSLAGDREALSVCILECIERLLTELCQKTGLPGDQIARIIITGNTTMLYLLTNRDVDCLSHAPFDADELFGREFPMQFQTAPAARCYLTRCNSAFVGGDITTAVLASGITEENKTALLIDVGTNGEIALIHDGKMYCSSTAAGPALEGAGIYMGMPALGGAIRRVWLDAEKKICCETVGDLPDTGICGSGVIDAMALLLKIGAVDETGLLLEEDHDYIENIQDAGNTLAFRFGEKTLFTQKDIRAVQLAKAAICAGICTLLHEAGLTPANVERFVIAGGFGSHINVENAAAIGLYPAELAEKAEVLGNAALEGAEMILQRKAFYAESEQIAYRMETVDLSSNPFFSDQYMESMMFTAAEL